MSALNTEANQKLAKLCAPWREREGDSSQLLAALAMAMRGAFPSHNVILLHHDMFPFFSCIDAHAQATAIVNDHVRGHRRFEARVFKQGTLDVKVLKDREDRQYECAGWGAFERQGDMVVFRAPADKLGVQKLDVDHLARDG